MLGGTGAPGWRLQFTFAQEIRRELGETPFRGFLLVRFNRGFREEPFQKVDSFLGFYNLFGVGVIGVVTELLVATWLLLSFHSFCLIKNIFEDINISSLKLFVFNNTSGKQDIKSCIFGLLKILIECISFGEGLGLDSCT